MRNLLQFIIKYSNFLLFGLLEIAALVLLFTFSSYPRSAYVTSANLVSGELYKASDAVTSYMHLGAENVALIEENARLLARIQELENQLEPYVENDSSRLYPDCNPYRYAHKAMRYIPAKVINIESGKRHNCFTLNKGRRDGIEEDMGVVDQHGVVALICAVSERFSLVMPLINDQMQLSCRFKNDETYGPLVWNGVDPRYGQLINIARHANVHVGDTIITSGLTPAFPGGLMVGMVDEAVLKDSDAYYRIRVRYSTDFRSIGYVQVVANDAMREQNNLENR